MTTFTAALVATGAILGIGIYFIAEGRDEMSRMREMTAQLEAENLRLRERDREREGKSEAELRRKTEGAREREAELLEELRQLRKINEDANARFVESEKQRHKLVKHVEEYADLLMSQGSWRDDEWHRAIGLWAELGRLLDISKHEDKAREFESSLYRIYQPGF